MTNTNFHYCWPRMIFTIPRIIGDANTKTIELIVIEDQVVVSGDFQATRPLRSVQDRLNGMVLGEHLCQPLLSFQEGGATLLINSGEIVFSVSQKHNGHISTETYIQRIDFSLATAREFFGAKKLTPSLPEFSERRFEAALRQQLGVVAGGVCIDTAGAAVAVRWKHKAYPWKNMRFGKGVIVATESEYSESIATIKSLNGWEGAIRFCSYLLSLDIQVRPHNQMLTYGRAVPQNWDLMGKDLEFLSKTLSLANSLEV